MARVQDEVQHQGRPRWSVSKCQHGCFHVDLGHVVLRLTNRELRALVRLLGDAYVEFGVEERMLEAEVAIPHTSPH